MQFLFECAGIENPRASSWKWNDIFFDFTSHAKLNVHPVQVCFMITSTCNLKPFRNITIAWCSIFPDHDRNSGYERCFFGVLIVFWVWFIPLINWPLR